MTCLKLLEFIFVPAIVRLLSPRIVMLAWFTLGRVPVGPVAGNIHFRMTWDA